MNLITVFQRFPDHEACIEHLERARWGDYPACPHCGSVKVARKQEHDRVGRWNCHDCHNSYNVLSGTIFQKTRVPLQKWFLAISLMLNAKKSLSSHQLARDLELNQKTAWYLMMRVRKAMVDDNADFLQGIVEADETYVGGKPRKPNKREDFEPSPRGRGTDKLPVIGAVERGGRVVAEPSVKVDFATLSDFLTDTVDRNSLLVTDQYPAYNRMREYMNHTTVDHSKQYVDGIAHTNTIEGFWALLKRAWYGQHHHYSKRHSFAYVVEACFKYNVRKVADPFLPFIQSTVTVMA
jgi:transposase-like protein